MHSLALSHSDLLTILIHQLVNPCIVDGISMHNKQTHIVLAYAMQKHVYILYHMHSIASTHIDLLPILIHQLVNPFIVNHYWMHIKQPQIVLASAMYKHVYIQYHMHSIVLTQNALPPIIIHQNISFIINHSSSNQAATNGVSLHLKCTNLTTYKITCIP